MRYSPQIHKKIPILIICFIFLLVGAYFVYGYYSKNVWPFRNTTPTASYAEDENTSGSTRTVEDDEESQDAKKRIIEEEDNPTTPTNTISVLITSSRIVNGNLEVRAFTDNVIESGTCTLTAQKGSSVQSVTGPAFIDATSTICEPLELDASGMSAGEWSLTVMITTTTSQGTSDTVKTTI